MENNKKNLNSLQAVAGLLVIAVQVMLSKDYREQAHSEMGQAVA